MAASNNSEAFTWSCRIGGPGDGDEYRLGKYEPREFEIGCCMVKALSMLTPLNIVASHSNQFAA
jgi:hypothetical protein